jgi:uncharacterized protein (TIGR00369 family)
MDDPAAPPAVLIEDVTFGRIDPAVARSMAGLELLRAMRDHALPAPTIGRALDFVIRDVEPGRVTFVGRPDARFYNPLGQVHGGYAATLLDSCMGCAVHTQLAAGVGYTTLEIKINYIRAMSDRTGEVIAEGRALHVGRQTATAEGFLRDAAGKLLAHGTTTCIVFQP